MEVITNQEIENFVGHCGWLSAQHIYNGESEWISYSLIYKAFILDDSLSHGKVRFSIEEIAKGIVNKLCQTDVLEFRRVEGDVQLRLKRKELKTENNKENETDGIRATEA